MDQDLNNFLCQVVFCWLAMMTSIATCGTACGPREQVTIEFEYCPSLNSSILDTATNVIINKREKLKCIKSHMLQTSYSDKRHMRQM